MNYKRIYDCIIDRARARVPDGYGERHHVVPRCMGGGDDKSNLAALTPEEHFLCHILLVKIYPEEPNLIIAVQKMTRGHKGRRSRKLYGWLRRKFAERMSELQSGKGNSQFGTRWKWCYDPASLRIKKLKLGEEIPEGWTLGLPRSPRKPSKPSKPSKPRPPRIRDWVKSNAKASASLKERCVSAKPRQRVNPDLPEEVRKKMRKPKSEEARQKMSNKLWITDGVVLTKINRGELLPEGFWFGRKKKNPSAHPSTDESRVK